MPVDIRWSDMDQMGHVNNAKYLTYFENARIIYFQEACAWNWEVMGAILGNAHVDYIRPIVYGNPSTIYTRISKLGTKSFEVSYLITSLIKGNEEIMTTGYTTMIVFDYQNNRSIPIPDEIRNRIKAYEKVDL